MAIQKGCKNPRTVLKGGKEYDAIEKHIMKRVMEEKETWFSGKTLFGGENSSWEKTPLNVLYQRRCEFYKNVKKITNPGILDKKATKQAGKDLGYILLQVLIDSKHTFDRRKNWVWEYQLID